MYVIKEDRYRVPVFIWCPEIEANTQEQIDHCAQLPFVAHHVAILPDAHFGFGVPIGTVLACKDVVIPFAVGSDIGCGMLATKTSLTEITREQVKLLMGGIRRRIPVGFEWHKTPVRAIGLRDPEDLPVIKSQIKKAELQLGSLGSGNHFLEIQQNEVDNSIWFMIHSGSRNLGKQVADHYNKIAKEMNARWFSSVDPKWDLAFLPIEELQAKLYLKEMQYAVEFAQRNRDVMAEQIRETFWEVFGNSVLFEPAINIAHNYAAWEEIGNESLIIHRKGATAARTEEIGIIPGSQGSSSYIVKGLGNPKSFYSCSHGAGRKMGRNQAKKELNLANEIMRLDELGVVHGIRSVKDLDEAAGAYKPIEQVMHNQQDLVKIITKLTPLGVVKG